MSITPIRKTKKEMRDEGIEFLEGKMYPMSGDLISKDKKSSLTFWDRFVGILQFLAYYLRKRKK